MVGAQVHKKVGDPVEEGEPLITLYHAERGLPAALAELAEAFWVERAPVAARPLVLRTVEPEEA